MRIQNSLRNMITAVMQIVVTIILRFIAQSYFIHILGLKYQGLNGLFSSIIGMLGIAELGLGTLSYLTCMSILLKEILKR